MSKLANHYRNVALDELYISAEVLPEEGAVVTIESWRHDEEVKSERGIEKKFVLRLKGKKKGFIANKTNRKLIAAALGTPYCDEWIGQKIRLVPVWGTWFGEKRQAIRVKPA